MDAYTERNAILLELGFKDYRAYLRSALWKNIRARKIEQDPACYGCGCGTNLVHLGVHHGSYDYNTLVGNSSADLYTICRRCHQYIEVSPAGAKRNPQQATALLHRIREMRLKKCTPRGGIHT